MKKLLVLLLGSNIFAHEVIWTENEFGFPGDFPLTPPLTIYYTLGDPNAGIAPPFRLFDIAPTQGEPCVVEVQMNTPDSPFLSIPNLTPLPKRTVPIKVQLAALPLSTNKIETAVFGRWRAVFPQDPKVDAVCDATNWNNFVVPIEIVAAPRWKVYGDSLLGTINIDTGGINVGFAESCFIGGPYKVISYGNKLIADLRMRPSDRYYTGSYERLANVLGKITDTSGTPLSGWQIGLAEGGIKTTVTSQGTYQLDPLPRGSVNLRGWSMLPYTDPMTAKPATQYAGIIFPVQSTERYETFDVQINAQVFPMAATPYVPWLAIGSGSFNSLQPSIYYSGGVGAPTGTSRRDSGLQLWMIPPDGKAFTVPTGPREENVIPNPQAGTYTLQGQLPDKPAFSISLKMAF